MRKSILFALLAASSAFADSLPSVAWEPERKKVVSFGWEWGPITPAEYVKYADRIDRTGLDGVGVYVKAKDASGKTVAPSIAVYDIIL